MQSECKVDANSKPWLDSGKTVLLQRVSSLEVKHETSNVSDGSCTHECAAGERTKRKGG